MPIEFLTTPLTFDPRLFHVAWIQHKTQVYYSCFPKELSVSDGVPSSAAIKLIQGIFDLQMDLSFFILRNRIYTTQSLSPMTRAMVKLSAKRITGACQIEEFLSALENHTSTLIGGEEVIFASRFDAPISFSAERLNSESEIIHFLKELQGQTPRGTVLHDYDRAIAAVALSDQGLIIGASTNRNRLNKTLHCEVRLLQQNFLKTKKPLPKNCKIYVSLKPCRMCAEMIYEASESPDTTRIYYLENDPGKLAKGSRFEQSNQMLAFGKT